MADVDFIERNFKTNGIEGKIRIFTHPSGHQFAVEVSSLKHQLTPIFIETALYDAAAEIARQHGLMETMLKLKQEAWS